MKSPRHIDQLRRRVFRRFTAVLAMMLALTSAQVIATETLLHHVHGLAFSPDGKQLLIPSHLGIAVYNEGRWSKAPGPRHDYMGFAATKTSLFSSGHPAPGTGLVNPFGLIRSGDGGRTWGKLGLEGESDFHFLAAGYQTNAIYVYNVARNSKMDRTGIHYTVNQGLLWRHADAQGLAGKIAALAVHPTDAARVAVATDRGVFLSTDSGARFEQLAGGEQAFAVYFDLDGNHLWVGSYRGRAALARIDLKNRQAMAMPLPELTRDAVAYIAQNPRQPSHYAIATLERDVYLSQDAGRRWTAIARRGMIP